MDTGYIRINNDMWSDIGKIYKVLSYFKPSHSTGVHLELEAPDGTTEKKVVPVHDIEWVERGASIDSL